MKITLIFDDGLIEVTGDAFISSQQLANLQPDAVTPFFLQIGEMAYRQVLKRYLAECTKKIMEARAQEAGLSDDDREILTTIYKNLGVPGENNNEGEGS